MRQRAGQNSLQSLTTLFKIAGDLEVNRVEGRRVPTLDFDVGVFSYRGSCTSPVDSTSSQFDYYIYSYGGSFSQNRITNQSHPIVISAMFDAPFIDFQNGQDYLDIVGAPILADPDDHEGVQIAILNLAEDLQKVTGRKPAVLSDVETRALESVILIGSLTKSKYIQQLVETQMLHIGDLKSKWESFQTTVLECPWPLAKRMLVITGSDKRGTIFGTYTLSEQIGVSP